MIKRTFILPLLGVAAIAAGCGGAYGDQSAAAPAKVPAAKPAATVVELRDTSFQPAAISVKVGDTITFVNRDPIAHTATATAGAKFDSGTLNAGAKFSYTAKRAGTIRYVCNFHPGMTGTITVTPGEQVGEATRHPAKVTVPDLT